ncbi:MAG: M1 family metallopeptidase [Candidatus Krumholzibacteriia bacterium]
MHPRLRLVFRLAALCCVCLAGPAAGAVPITPAALPGEGPAAPEYAARQERYLESVVKGRVAKGLARAEALKSPGQDLYDVHHYDLALNLDPTTQILSGTVTIAATVTGPSLAVMDLDLKANMAVSGCVAGGVPTTFSRNLDVLSVDLDRVYATGEKVVVAVTYAGNPAGESFGWSTYSLQPLIWTLSEPYGARDWWPCKDLNTDKADSVDVRATVPANLIVTSNGVLRSDVTVGGTRTAHWHEGHPIATYLVALTIHPFVTFSHWYTPLAGGAPMEVKYFVVANRLAQAEVGYAPTVSMITAFAHGFGEYPFVDEKYGHVHFPWGGGMEHQTLTSLSYNAYSSGIIAHELSHQWWGDFVTCANFQHIWLNEGFATWCEAYWREQSEGIAAYHAEMAGTVYLGAGSIFVEDPSDFNAIFDYYLSYAKASWVVHMLRHVLGDADFFASLAAYRAAYGNGSATTEQFRDVCEGVSGKDLDAFFQQWIYGQYYPQYQYAWWFAPAGDSTRVNLRVRQTQTVTGLFTLPVDIFVDTDRGTVVRVVQNDQAEQVYALTVPGVASNVTLDRDNWILKTAAGAAITPAPDVPPAFVASLGANRPNPFNPATLIPYELPRAGRTRLALYDTAGRLVRLLVDGELAAGPHEARWDGRDEAGRPVGSGAYFARLSFAGETRTRSLLLAR